jgi:D-3-phosphoglycerate dehydrogenase / 2-oxoglutarate reductase
MRRKKVLVTAPRAVADISRYESALRPAGCEVVFRAPVERVSEAELLSIVADVDGMVCGDDQITSRVLDAAPNLRVICKWGTGIDSIDVDGARSRGIVVRNSPGAFSNPVADTVLGYVLLFARQLERMATDMRAGRWQRVPLRALDECTLGIVGLGSIGSAVAHRAASFGMRILATTLADTARNEVAIPSLRKVSLDALLAESDFVTVHADMRPENRHLIGAAELACMQPTAVLINTARGGLVDECALIAALSDGRLAGAALDVFENEPVPVSSPLRGMSNVYLAPHNANASGAAAERVHANCIDDVLRVLCPTDER